MWNVTGSRSYANRPTKHLTQQSGQGRCVSKMYQYIFMYLSIYMGPKKMYITVAVVPTGLFYNSHWIMATRCIIIFPVKTVNCLTIIDANVQWFFFLCIYFSCWNVNTFIIPLYVTFFFFYYFLEIKKGEETFLSEHPLSVIWVSHQLLSCRLVHWQIINCALNEEQKQSKLSKTIPNKIVNLYIYIV